MRVRVPKNRRVEELGKDLGAGRGWASLEGCRESGLSERLEERTEAILRMLGKEEKRTGGDK
jgi:hypothetical protein